MQLNIRKIKLCIYIYIYIGMILFFLGWVKWVFSLPVVLIIAFVWLRYRKYFHVSMNTEQGILFVSKRMIIATIIFSIVLALLCGFGGFCFQAHDWVKHNFILNDLVNKPWPVYYQNDDSSAMLTYYIAQYLCPALCGKFLGGFRGAELVLLFYSVIGILAVIILLYHILGADNSQKQSIVLLCFLFLGTCLFFGKALYGLTVAGSEDAPDNWKWISEEIYLQYRSLFVNLRWAFPQAIVPWLSTLLFADDIKAVRNYGLITVPLLLYSPFTLVGLAFMMLMVIIYRIVTEKSRTIVQEVFSIENIFSAVISVIPLVYLLGNVMGEKPDSIGFSIIGYQTNSALYFCFISSFFFYSVTIFRKCSEDILFYLVNISLLLIPFFKMGKWNDFSLNVSIPSILLLMVLVVKTLFVYMEQHNRYREQLVVLLLLLACGSLTTMEDLKAVISEPVSVFGMESTYQDRSLNDWARRDGSISVDRAYNYFTYDYTDSLFYTVFAKNRSD